MLKKKHFWSLALFFITASLIAQEHNAIPNGENLTDQEKKMILHIQNSIQQAEIGNSKLNKKILKIDGFSSNKVRHFLNNICSIGGTHYLEIGCWKGSTWVSALYQNDASILEAVAIDNWSEFDGPKEDFFKNCEKFLPSTQYKFISADCFSINLSDYFTKPINVYFFDGNHSELSQELALTYYDVVLDDLFILIVDDWNWAEVKNGTYKAIDKLNYTVLFFKELPSPFNSCKEEWWNGLFVALVRKEK